MACSSKEFDTQVRQTRERLARMSPSIPPSLHLSHSKSSWSPGNICCSDSPRLHLHNSQEELEQELEREWEQELEQKLERESVAIRDAHVHLAQCALTTLCNQNYGPQAPSKIHIGCS